MAREVLTAAQHAGVFIASDRSFSKDCHQSGIVAVTPYTDDWVVSVTIDVQHWCHGKVWSQAPELPGTYEITAVCSADPEVSASAFVIVE